MRPPLLSIIYSASILLFSFSSTSLCAQDQLISSQAQVSARAIAMGSAFSALADDAAAFAYNPSGISLEKSFVLSGMYSSLHGTPGTPLGNLTWTGFCAPLKDFHLSANWIRFQSSDQRTNPKLIDDDLDASEALVRNNRLNSFSTQYEDALSVTIARNNILKIDWGWNQYVLPIEFPLGITARYTHSSLAGLGASAWSVDVGSMMRINLRDMFFNDDYPYFCVSWTVKNLGGVVQRWQNSRSDYYPSRSILGCSIIQPLEWLESQVSLDYEVDKNNDASSRIGLEWKYRKYYFVRSGFYSSAFCVGLGADLGFFLIDYAYQSRSTLILGDSHHLSIAFRMERLFL